jgi:hypothetical protein
MTKQDVQSQLLRMGWDLPSWLKSKTTSDELLADMTKIINAAQIRAVDDYQQRYKDSLNEYLRSKQ